MFDKLKEMAGGADGLSKVLSGEEFLKEGAKGEAVELVQKALGGGGFDAGAVDGMFGPKTKAAVVAMQQKFGLESDGVVGPKTGEAIKKLIGGLSAGDGFAKSAGDAIKGFKK